MSHTAFDEEAAGRAALYALGALEGAEAREFEGHLAAGCARCEAGLREFEAVAGDLGLAAPAAEPPGGVRARLLALAAEEKGGGPAGAGISQKGAPGFLVVRAGEGRWRPTGDAGVSFKLLFADRGRGTVTALVRMEPGSRIRSHRHLGVEQCLVLEGDVRSGEVGMRAGDFNCSLPGSVHEELFTEGGALLLLVSPEHYEPVGPRAGSTS
ncbi:MAG TPA: cupin domain-containing protein [Pyrinomonadaceae bacterium]|jgi:anti-sigma factor ChrR (cupin superfamily)